MQKTDLQSGSYRNVQRSPLWGLTPLPVPPGHAAWFSPWRRRSIGYSPIFPTTALTIARIAERVASDSAGHASIISFKSGGNDRLLFGLFLAFFCKLVCTRSSRGSVTSCSPCVCKFASVVLKTTVRKGTGGSNPSCSVALAWDMDGPGRVLQAILTAIPQSSCRASSTSHCPTSRGACRGMLKQR